MGKTIKRAVGPIQLAAAAATLYTAPAGTQVRIAAIWLQTPTAARTVTMSVGADAAATRFLDAYALTANVPATLYPGQILNAGEVIQGFASAATSVVAMITVEEYLPG